MVKILWLPFWHNTSGSIPIDIKTSNKQTNKKQEGGCCCTSKIQKPDMLGQCYATKKAIPVIIPPEPS